MVLFFTSLLLCSFFVLTATDKVSAEISDDFDSQLITGANVVIVPGVPTNLSVIYDGAKAVLDWDAPVDGGGSAVTGYNLYRSTTSGGIFSVIASPSGPNYSDTNLTKGQTYWYKVSAVNADGEGPQSPAFSIDVPRPASDNTLTLMVLIGIIVMLVVVLLVAVPLIIRNLKRKK